MARVKKTSSKKGRINSTRYGKKFKRKYQKKKDYKIEMASVHQRWNYKKSLKFNMRNLGLVFDINSDIKRKNRTKTKMEHLPGTVETMEDESMAAQDTADTPSNNNVVEMFDGLSTCTKKKRKKRSNTKSKQLFKEFEERASKPERQRCHLSTAEAEYVALLLEKHGTDYKGMTRDKLNYDQLTEAQLRKKCEALLSSRETRHLKLFKNLDLI